ncbi:MAG: TorF family putative porin [Gammaproteobacteria bacterium]
MMDLSPARWALLPAIALTCSTNAAADFSANAGVSNNYLWRGLTQTENTASISGGIDFDAGNGFYAGTWAANVSYAPGDVFSYEHDLYGGFSGESGAVSYDVGYLYYNYDETAEFDFGEIYGVVGFGNFSVSLNVLANTEADESPGQDFGFGQAYYLGLDYATTVGNDVELAVHVGYHDGDFNEAFNGVPGSYADYNVSLSKDGFFFTVSGTDLDDAGPDGLDNDAIKFVVGYSVEIAL